MYVPVEERKKAARRRYDAALKQAGGVERMVSGSDDFTLCLWTPSILKTSICKC